MESLYSLTTGQCLEIAIAFLAGIMTFRGRVIYTLVLETGNTQAGIRFEDIPACERNLGTGGILCKAKWQQTGRGMKEGRLYVRNRDFSVTNEGLREMVSRYGEVRHAEMSEGSVGPFPSQRPYREESMKFG